MTWLRIVLATTLLTSFAVAGDATDDGLKAPAEVIEAWKDMRFGMFLCWGPVSLTGKEIGWSRGTPSWGRRPGVRGAKGPTPVDVYDAEEHQSAHGRPLQPAHSGRPRDQVFPDGRSRR